MPRLQDTGQHIVVCNVEAVDLPARTYGRSLRYSQVSSGLGSYQPSVFD